MVGPPRWVTGVRMMPWCVHVVGWERPTVRVNRRHQPSAAEQSSDVRLDGDGDSVAATADNFAEKNKR